MSALKTQIKNNSDYFHIAASKSNYIATNHEKFQLKRIALGNVQCQTGMLSGKYAQQNFNCKCFYEDTRNTIYT